MSDKEQREIANELEWLADQMRNAGADIDAVRSIRDMLTAELKRRREAGYVEHVGCTVDYRPGRHGRL